MALALKTALMDKDTQKNLIDGAVGVLNAAPVAAMATVVALFVSWQLEHLSFETGDIPIYANQSRTIITPITTITPHGRSVDFVERSVTEKVIIGYRTGRKLTRLSTADTSFLNDPNKTPLMPPIQSTAIRLADAGSDVAEAAFALAQQQLESTKAKGLIQTGLEFLFGGG